MQDCWEGCSRKQRLKGAAEGSLEGPADGKASRTASPKEPPIKPTCDVDIMIGLQPSLHADEVVLVHQEDDIFGPIDLAWGKSMALASQ